MSAPLHTCAVPGCGAVIPTHLLMCRGHWFRVPRETQAKVTRAWRRYTDGELSIVELRGVQQQAIDRVKGGVM